MSQSPRSGLSSLLAVTGFVIILGADTLAQFTVKPSQLLTMRGFTANACPAQTLAGARAIDYKLLPDGTHAPFEIPGDQVFVVTDVVFRVASAQSVNTNVRLGTPCEAPSSGCMQLWLDGVVTTSNAGESGETRVSLRHGFSIASGVPICIAATNGDPNTFADLHGYLEKK